MKSIGSVVTYLIFEFLIPASYTYTYTCGVHSAHCMKMHRYFLLNITGHQLHWGTRQIQL